MRSRKSVVSFLVIPVILVALAGAALILTSTAGTPTAGAQTQSYTFGANTTANAPVINLTEDDGQGSLDAAATKTFRVTRSGTGEQHFQWGHRSENPSSSTFNKHLKSSIKTHPRQYIPWSTDSLEFTVEAPKDDNCWDQSFIFFLSWGGELVESDEMVAHPQTGVMYPLMVVTNKQYMNIKVNVEDQGCTEIGNKTTQYIYNTNISDTNWRSLGSRTIVLNALHTKRKTPIVHDVTDNRNVRGYARIAQNWGPGGYVHIDANSQNFDGLGSEVQLPLDIEVFGSEAGEGRLMFANTSAGARALNGGHVYRTYVRFVVCPTDAQWTARRAYEQEHNLSYRWTEEFRTECSDELNRDGFTPGMGGMMGGEFDVEPDPNNPILPHDLNILPQDLNPQATSTPTPTPTATPTPTPTSTPTPVPQPTSTPTPTATSTPPPTATPTPVPQSDLNNNPTPLNAGPVGLPSLDATSNTTLTISWPAVNGASGYEVRYWRRDPWKAEFTKLSVNGTTTTLTGLTPDKLYFVRVLFVDDTGVRQDKASPPLKVSTTP